MYFVMCDFRKYSVKDRCESSKLQEHLLAQEVADRVVDGRDVGAHAVLAHQGQEPEGIPFAAVIDHHLAAVLGNQSTTFTPPFLMIRSASLGGPSCLMMTMSLG